MYNLQGAWDFCEFETFFGTLFPTSDLQPTYAVYLRTNTILRACKYFDMVCSVNLYFPRQC